MAFIFAKLDVTLRDHDRLLKAIKSVGWGALGVYSWAMMYLREKQSETGVLSDEVIDMSMPNQKDTRRIVEALVVAGLFVRRPAEGGFYLHNYEKKNDTKAVIDEKKRVTLERVTRYRSGCNANVTSGEDVHVPTSTSTSTSTLRDPEGSAEGGAAKPSARGSRLPEAWRPSEKTIAWCRTVKRVAAKDVERILERFAMYFLGASGERGVKANWDRAFQSWVLRELDDGKIAPTLEATIPAADLPPEKLVSPQRLLELTEQFSKIGQAS